jgi:predicted lipase
MLSAIPWITDSTIVQNIVIIAIVSSITSQIQLHKSQTLQIHSGKQSGNEPPSSSRATGRHIGM